MEATPRNAVVPEPENDRGGVWVTLGAHAYKVPPLNFKMIKQLVGKLGALSEVGKGSAPTADQMALVAELAHAALRRNYPHLSLDQVEEDLDLGNFQQLFEAVMSVSGLVKKGSDAGEVRGATPDAP